MIKSKVVDLIKMRLGNRTDPGIDTRIGAELDMAQYVMERFGDFTPWFLLSETARYTTTPGESRVPVPTDMLQEYEEGALFYDGEALTKYDYDALVEKYGVAEGEPEAYALVDDYFIVFPVPDDFYQLSMKYYQEQAAPSTLADGDTSVWLKNAADWLLAKAGAAAARFIKDAEAVALFTADEQAAAARVYKVHIDRAERNTERRMGDE